MAQDARTQPAGELLLRRRTRLERYRERAANARRALRKNPNMLLGLVIILFMVLMAVLATVLATHDPKYLVPRERLVSPEALTSSARTISDATFSHVPSSAVEPRSR